MQDLSDAIAVIVIAKPECLGHTGTETGTRLVFTAQTNELRPSFRPSEGIDHEACGEALGSCRLLDSTHDP
jgi:hypothetical protein